MKTLLIFILYESRSLTKRLRISALDVLASSLVVLLFQLPPARAHAVDPFEFQIYGYATQGQGNFAPQLLNSYVARGRAAAGEGLRSQSMLRSALELEYGLTRRVDFAYYLNVALPDRQRPQYAGSKFRLRGSFAEPGDLPVDLGWYAEVEWWRDKFDDDTVEAEVMLTMQKDWGPFALILNLPDIDKVLKGTNRHGLLELSYRAEARCRFSDDVHIGLQAYGGVGEVDDMTPLRQQTHYLAPVVHVRFPANVKATFGLIFGLTQSSDFLLLKTNLTFNSHDQEWD